MNFEIGKLYKCSSHCLLIFPTEETACGTNWITGEKNNDAGNRAAAYWSKELNCKVGYSNPNDPFMVLKISNKDSYGDFYINVLFGDKIGWIVYNEEWKHLKFERTI